MDQTDENTVGKRTMKEVTKEIQTASKGDSESIQPYGIESAIGVQKDDGGEDLPDVEPKGPKEKDEEELQNHPDQYTESPTTFGKGLSLKEIIKLSTDEDVEVVDMPNEPNAKLITTENLTASLALQKSFKTAGYNVEEQVSCRFMIRF